MVKPVQKALDANMFNLKTIGKSYQRQDDKLEQQHLAKRKERINAGTYDWLKPPQSQYRDFGDIEALDEKYINGILARTPRGKANTLLDIAATIKGVVGRSIDTVNDLIHGRRVKTSLLKIGLVVGIIGLVAAGVAIPPVAGGYLAVGSVIGLGLVTGTAAQIGIAAAMFGVIGTYVGFRVGEMGTRYLFPDEKREATSRQVRRWKRHLAIDEPTLNLINNYLINRIEATKESNPTLSKALFALKKAAINKASSKGIHHLVLYLCQDLESLCKNPNPSNRAWRNEVEALELMLFKIQMGEARIQKNYVTDEALARIDETFRKVKAVTTNASADTCRPVVTPNSSSAQPVAVTAPRHNQQDQRSSTSVASPRSSGSRVSTGSTAAVATINSTDSVGVSLVPRQFSALTTTVPASFPVSIEPIIIDAKGNMDIDATDLSVAARAYAYGKKRNLTMDLSDFPESEIKIIKAKAEKLLQDGIDLNISQSVNLTVM